MAIWNPKFVGAALHSVTKHGGLPIVNLPSIQVVKSECKSRRVCTNVTRRDTMLYLTTGTLFGPPLLSTEPAGARVGRLENKKKALEKLEKVREEAEISKQKTKSYAQKPLEERVPPTLVPPLSFPNSKQVSPGPFIETMMPSIVTML